MKYFWIVSILVILGCCDSRFCFVENKDITNMYSSYIDEWQSKSKTCFENAEKEILKPKPNPQPEILRPDPDPAKCICKGTGIIIHGDGHKTPCEYHGGPSLHQKGNVRTK